MTRRQKLVASTPKNCAKTKEDEHKTRGYNIKHKCVVMEAKTLTYLGMGWGYILWGRIIWGAGKPGDIFWGFLG